MLAQSGKHLLAYDSDCGPCTRFRRMVAFLDLRKRIEFISISKAQKDGLLNRIPFEDHYKAFHLLLPGGQIRSGSDGLVELIGILPGGTVAYPIVTHFPGARKVVHFIYTNLARLHDGDSCAVSDTGRT